MPESFPSHPEALLAGILAGVALTILSEMIHGALRRWKRRGLPQAQAQLHIFESDGDHFLSAKLDTLAIQRLLEEFNGGHLKRIGHPVRHLAD